MPDGLTHAIGMPAFEPGEVPAPDFLDVVRRFSSDGVPTEEFDDRGLRYFVNAYWTARQRDGHSLQEVSYRACFKPQLPEFFIARLTSPGDTVYDPFAGRGTTPIQAALMGRRPIASDVNPLSAMLIAPRLVPPPIAAVRERLREIGLDAPTDAGRRDGTTGQPSGNEPDLSVFYHPDTLRQLRALRAWLLGRAAAGRLDAVDGWVRMVAINRLTGHSPGFFSVYTMPPNQAVSVESQRKINAARGQTPPPRDVAAIILKKSRALLADGAPKPHPPAVLTTGPADAPSALADGSVDLIVTSPPFLDIVDYHGDNWLRCWFAGIDPDTVRIDRHRDVGGWEAFVRRDFKAFARIVRPGGFVAFEVGEVRGGSVLLERHVAAAVAGLPFDLLGVMINRQVFTKTANCWGVGNNRRGTNTNRIVMLRRLG